MALEKRFPSPKVGDREYRIIYLSELDSYVLSIVEFEDFEIEGEPHRWNIYSPSDDVMMFEGSIEEIRKEIELALKAFDLPIVNFRIDHDKQLHIFEEPDGYIIYSYLVYEDPERLDSLN